MTLRFVTGVTLVLVLGLAACSQRQPRNVEVSTVVGQQPTAEQNGAPTEEDGALANTLRWATASEIDNFGFDVYRADSEDGPFERLTDRPIEGAGTADVPTDYAYVDETIVRGRDYFYYVESISMDGQRSRFTPIIRAAAKH